MPLKKHDDKISLVPYLLLQFGMRDVWNPWLLTWMKSVPPDTHKLKNTKEHLAGFSLSSKIWKMVNRI